MEDHLRLGLLNWFPMNPGESLLLVGVGELLKKDFSRRGICVTHIRDIKEISQEKKYDYIVVCNGEDFFIHEGIVITFLRRMLKNSGHLLFACENRLALRNFVGDKDPYTEFSFDGVENYWKYTNEDFGAFSGRCYSKCEIERFIQRIGFSQNEYRGYSIFPGLEMPQLIYAWDYLPQEDLEMRYTPLYHDARGVFLNETNLCNSLIQNGMFHQMANAYLVDCTFSGEFYEFDQVTTSMERGEERATATILQKNGKVIKKALYPQCNSKIHELSENMRELEQRRIATVHSEECAVGRCDQNDLSGIKMDYICAPIAMKYLQNLMVEDKDAFIEKTCELMDLVLRSGEENGEKESELGPIYKRVYFDMVPLNCFYLDDKFVFFDQEYVIENYPINVVLVRVLDLIYTEEYRTKDIIPISYFTDRYNLTEKLVTYRTLSKKYLDELRHSAELFAFHRIHKADATVINRNREKMNYSIEEYIALFVNYLKDTKDKKVFLFGSGRWARKFVAEYGDRVSIEALLDNNEANWGSTVEGIKVINPLEILACDSSTYKVIVCVKRYAAIVKQLKSMGVEYYGIYDPDIDVQALGMSGDEHSQKTIASEDSVADESVLEKPYHIGFVAGVFDLFHIGHLNLLRRAKEQCDFLLVGVVSDAQASEGKAHSPYVCEKERCEIVEACKYVDKAFVLPIAAARARDVYRKYHYNVMFSGSDYENDPSWLAEQAWLREHGSDLVFFPYTESTSSTKLKNAIEDARAKGK